MCVCVCNFCFSSFDHADQMHAFIGWHYHQLSTCCISFFLLSKGCHASFFKVSGGRYRWGFIADIGDETRNPWSSECPLWIQMLAQTTLWYSSLLYRLWQEPDPQLAKLKLMHIARFPSALILFHFHLRSFQKMARPSQEQKERKTGLKKDERT